MGFNYMGMDFQLSSDRMYCPLDSQPLKYLNDVLWKWHASLLCANSTVFNWSQTPVFAPSQTTLGLSENALIKWAICLFVGSKVNWGTVGLHTDDYHFSKIYRHAQWPSCSRAAVSRSRLTWWCPLVQSHFSSPALIKRMNANPTFPVFQGSGWVSAHRGWVH